MSKNIETIAPMFEIFYIESMKANSTMIMNSMKVVESFYKEIELLGLDELKQEKCAISQDLILDNLHNIVLNCAALSRYFWSYKSEQTKIRSEFLRMKFDLDDNSPLRIRTLRNTIEHFDENLDKFIGRTFSGYVFPKYVGFSFEDNHNAHFFKAFYIDTVTYEILGKKFEIGAMLREATRVHTMLEMFSDNGGFK